MASIPTSCVFEYPDDVRARVDTRREDNGEYRMVAKARKRFTGPNYALGVIFRDEADYLARGAAEFMRLRLLAQWKAEAILSGTDDDSQMPEHRELELIHFE